MASKPVGFTSQFHNTGSQPVSESIYVFKQNRNSEPLNKDQQRISSINPNLVHLKDALTQVSLT